MSESGSPDETLGRTLTLPCGATLRNRIAKAAMSDSLGDGAGDPTEAQMRLYERWAQGEHGVGVALSIIGEAQVDPRYPEKPGNLALAERSDESALRRLADRGTADGAHLWPQLGHAGALAQAPFGRPKGPSPLRLDGLDCDGLSAEEVQALPGQFAAAAEIARRCGFTGVEIHAAHGFLLSQFLSPLFNRRQDGYGGAVEARGRILLETIDAVRRAVGPGFPIGVKINATDGLDGGLAEDEALAVVALLDRTSLDLVEISGGAYFPGAAAASDAAGDGPYFIGFARRARAVTRTPLMLTGGFKRREQAVAAVASGAADLVGLARALVLAPALPGAWLSEAGGDPVFPRFATRPPPGGVTAWHTMRLTAVAEDREAAYEMDPAEALAAYDARDADRVARWRSAFGPG